MGLDWRKITTFFIVLTIIVIAIYDGIAYFKAGTSGTISFVLIEWSYSYPIFPFVVGMIMGHLFWRIKDDTYTSHWGRR